MSWSVSRSNRKGSGRKGTTQERLREKKEKKRRGEERRVPASQDLRVTYLMGYESVCEGGVCVGGRGIKQNVHLTMTLNETN